MNVNGYLDDVEAQLAELTERGAHTRLRARLPFGELRGAPGGTGGPEGGQRGPRRRRELLTIVPAVLVTVAVVLIVLSLGTGSQHSNTASRRTGHGHRSPQPRHLTNNPKTNTQSTTATSSATTGPSQPSGPVPAGFDPQSFTAVGEMTWWLLGKAPCSSPPCTSIVRTDDGGRTFVGTPAPRTDQVTDLRFADTEDGFAFGPQLWVTHDAGADWHQVQLPGNVSELAISDGYAYAIVRPACGCAPGRLMRTPVARDDWSTLPAAGNAAAGLWVQGQEVLLESGNSAGTAQQLAISQDGGLTFSTHSLPPNVTCQFQAPAPPVIWAHCVTGMLSGVWRWTGDSRGFVSVSSHGLPELPNSAGFGAASATTAIAGYRQLYRTTDGGASYQAVAAPVVDWWQYIAFTDQTHGVALGTTGTAGGEQLYYTTDGGASYHPVTIR